MLASVHLAKMNIFICTQWSPSWFRDTGNSTTIDRLHLHARGGVVGVLMEAPKKAKKVKKAPPLDEGTGEPPKKKRKRRSN